MPHYHLHLHNAHVDASDEEGMDLTDLAEAQSRAIEGIRDFLSHELKAGKIDMRGQVDIADDSGTILHSVQFSEAFTIIRS